jgi:hypothetical protein
VSPPRGPDPASDPVEHLLVAAGLALAAVSLAPMVVVAGGLAVLIDRRGWRRTPALLAGALLSVALGVTGGPNAYARTFAVVTRLAGGYLAGTTIALALAFATACGVACGPVLATLVHHRDEHELTRHARAVSTTRRASVQAARVARHGRWPSPPHHAVLGIPVAPTRPSAWVRGWRRPVVAVPMAGWRRQTLVVGETGSGKTMTALTIAGEAMRAGWLVYWIDGKADATVAAHFVQMAARHGVRAQDGTREPIDGWRGGPESVVNRLLATQRFTEPYYAGIARNVLRWAVGDDPPRRFDVLLERMDRNALRRAWRDHPTVAEQIRRLPEPDLLGARYRYEGVAWAVGSTLDGSWSYEDVPAAYVPVGRPEHRDQAAEIGAFLLEDLLHWAMARKDPHRDALVVIDEFSKLAGRPDAAVDLVERVRSFGVGVVLIGQTWASLGPSDAVRERLAGTVGTVIIHRLKAPERLVALAGTEWVLERTEQLLADTPTGRVSQRAGRRFVVGPDDVRALPCGEAFLITGSEALRLRVRVPPGNEAALEPGSVDA